MRTSCQIPQLVETHGRPGRPREEDDLQIEIVSGRTYDPGAAGEAVGTTSNQDQHEPNTNRHDRPGQRPEINQLPTEVDIMIKHAYMLE